MYVCGLFITENNLRLMLQTTRNAEDSKQLVCIKPGCNTVPPYYKQGHFKNSQSYISFQKKKAQSIEIFRGPNTLTTGIEISKTFGSHRGLVEPDEQQRGGSEKVKVDDDEPTKGRRWTCLKSSPEAERPGRSKTTRR